jgi:hypothetical protein
MSITKRISNGEIVGVLITISFFLFTSLSLAANPSGTTGESVSNPEATTGTRPPNPSGTTGAVPGQTVELINPIEADSISEFLVAIVDVLLIFATPLIVIYIMYAGFKFVTAQGNPSEIESARTALLWAVVGGVIVLGAKLILEVIQGTIEAFNTTP